MLGLRFHFLHSYPEPSKRNSEGLADRVGVWALGQGWGGLAWSIHLYRCSESDGRLCDFHFRGWILITCNQNQCTRLYFKRSSFLKALSLCLCRDPAKQQTENPHVTSLGLQHLKTGWQVGALQGEKRGKHCENHVLVIILAELENGLHLQLIRLTQLWLQMESLAPATTNVCWTCVVILPLNTTTCMTYFVFSWPLDWKTIKTTSALLSDWIRGKEQVSLVSFRLCLGYRVTAANHFPTPWKSDPEHEFSTGKSGLTHSKTKVPSDLGSNLRSPPLFILYIFNPLSQPLIGSVGAFFQVIPNPVWNYFIFHLVVYLCQGNNLSKRAGTMCLPPPPIHPQEHLVGASVDSY